jgi:lysyl-tRNA synthetase class 2
MEAYPASVKRDISLQQVITDFDELSGSEKTISVAGRILSLRGQGAIMFVTLFDGTERFQVVFKKDEIDPELFTLFSETVDLGDFISVTGTVFTTQKGAPSILA